MPSRPSRFLLLLPALALLACQGDRQGPVDLAERVIEGAGACKSDNFVNNNPYTNSQTKNAKEGLCRDAKKAADSGDHATAENIINQLQSALYSDYASCVGMPFGSAGTCVLESTDATLSFRQKVANFSKAICDLDMALIQTGLNPDCLPATTKTLAKDDEGGTNSIWGGWIAFGPVAETGWPQPNDPDAILLPNLEIGIVLVDLEDNAPTVFGTIRENEPTPTLGPCPGNSQSEKNCEQASYAINLDTPGSAGDNDPIQDPNGLYVEMCEDVFTTGEPGRGGATGFDPDDVTLVDPAIGLGLGCTRGGTAFAPSTWTVLSEEDAVRGIHVNVESASASISTGTTVTVFPLGGGPASPATCVVNGVEEPCTCITEDVSPPEQKKSQCTITGLDAGPGTIDYSLLAEKNAGTGSHTGTANFSLSVGDPSLGPPENGIKELPTVFVGP